jgi:hypothetical protein
MQTKKQYRWRLTYLPSLLTRRHWHSWISGEVNPRVWVVLNGGDLPRQPCKEVIVEGLYGPSTTLSRQQCCPSAYRRERRQVSSHCHPRTETWDSLEEKRAQDGPEPEVPLVPLTTICQLPLHYLEQCGAPVKNLCIHALNGTVHLCARRLMYGGRAGNSPYERQNGLQSQAGDTPNRYPGSPPVGPSHAILGYQLRDFSLPRRKCLQVDGFPSPREARQKVYVLGGGRQRLPLDHKGLGIRMPVINQGIQQPWLCAHERT